MRKILWNMEIGKLDKTKCKLSKNTGSNLFITFSVVNTWTDSCTKQQMIAACLDAF